MRWYIIGVFLLALVAAATGCDVEEIDEREIPMEETEEKEEIEEKEEAEEVTEIAELCEQLGGTWIDHANECEYIGEQECEALGGIFDGCASACRHDPDAEICIAVCVPVCYFE